MDALYNNKTRRIDEFGNSFTVRTRFHEFPQYGFYDKTILKTPACQVSLDEEIVKRTFDEISDDAGAFLRQGQIVIAVFENDKKQGNSYFLVDGQHRMEVARRINEKNNGVVSDLFYYVVFTKLKTIADLDKLFMSINRYSDRKSFLNGKDKQAVVYQQLYKMFKDEFIGCYEKKGNKSIYSLEEFMKELANESIFPDKNDIHCEADTILVEIKKFNKFFFDAVGYAIIDENLLTKPEQSRIELKNCMFLKNNNFIAMFCLYSRRGFDLSYRRLYPCHLEYCGMTEAFKRSVWKDKAKKAKIDYCDICDDEIDFEGCKFLPEQSFKDGGELKVENMVLVCNDCFIKCGAKNINDYKKQLMRK